LHPCYVIAPAKTLKAALTAGVPVVAADFIRNLREETRKGFYGRLKQGFYPLAAPRGYLDTGRAKAKAVDPVEAPLIREAFELYASGTYGIDTLRAEMQKRGLRTNRGEMLSRHGIANILHNPFYIGIIRLRKTDEVFAGIHEPIITKALFDKVQITISGRVFARHPNDPLQFRRFIKCSRCGLSLIGERQKGQVYYRCHSQSCRGATLRADHVENAVEENLRLLHLDDGDMGDVRDLLYELTVTERAREHERVAFAERDIANLTERLAALTDLLLDGSIDRDLFNERKAAFISARRQLEETRLPGSAKSETDRLRENIELGNMAWNMYEAGNTGERLQILKSVTSNFSYDGKELVFPMFSPFAEVREWAKMSECDPSRPYPRTSEGTLPSTMSSKALKLLRILKVTRPVSKLARKSPARHTARHETKKNIRATNDRKVSSRRYTGEKGRSSSKSH
jgi:site-specific DNA recombinase